MKKLSWLFVFGIIAFGSLGKPVRSQFLAQGNNGDLVNLQKLTCRELLKSSGEDRSSILIFLHGYVSGKAGETIINAPALAELTDKVVDGCIDNPNQILLKVFEANR